MPEAIDTLYILKALGFTILFVGLIGFERQKKNKIAGLTTHILVALGAAGVTIMQEQLYYDSIQLAVDFPELAGSIMFERQRIRSEERRVGKECRL